MAGLTPPSYLDGMSVLPLLVPDADDTDTAAALPTDTRAFLSQQQAAGVAPPHRLASFHEYYNQGPWEVGSRHPLDDWSNTYIALTYKGPLGYLKYGVYDPYGKQTNFSKPYMVELFDLDKDEYELLNIYNQTKTSAPATIATLHKMLTSFYACKPGECSSM